MPSCLAALLFLAADPRTLSVVVGVSRYADRKIEDRPRAEADAKALRKALGGEARLLLGSADGKEQATKENILDALAWLAKEAAPGDLAVFAFFGQGGPLGAGGERLAYFASDTVAKDRAKTAVDADDIARLLRPLKSKRFCAFIDFNLRGFISLEEPPLGETLFKEFLGDDGSDDKLPRPGRAILLASDGYGAALDLKEHGVFATALLDGLSGKADGDGDGVITFPELRRHVLAEVARLSRLHGKTAREKTHKAFGWGGRDIDYPLVLNPAKSAVREKRLKKLEELLQAGTLAPKFGDEGRALLSQMPARKAKRDLRALYQKLADGTASGFEEERERILASAEMDRAEADKFAAKIIDATRAIKSDYVRETDTGELVAAAVRGLYRDAEEKIPLRLDLKLRAAKGKDEKTLASLIADARQSLGKREDLDEGKDVALSLSRMLRSLDPQSSFVDEETLKKRSDDGTGGFTGIGINYRMDAFSEEARIESPIKGSPAYKACLVAGDTVTAIDGKPTKGLATEDVRKLVLGAEGTKIVLAVRREGENEKEYTLTRARVEPETVLGVARKASDDWDFMIDSKNRIGYIRMPYFGRASMKELREAAKSLEGMKGLVLDLRGNTGGLLNVTIEVGGLFVGDEVIARLKPRTGKEAAYRGKKVGALLGFPMACLVDRNTAVGGEMVAAALQDHKRARLFGERTYGLASVRSYKDVSGELKGQFLLTTSFFARPSGKNLNKSATKGQQDETWGVTPDEVVTFAQSERNRMGDYNSSVSRIEGAAARARPNRPEFKDRQLEAALAWLRSQTKGR